MRQACLPVAMSGRNWMLRRMLTRSIRNDPEWYGGNYRETSGTDPCAGEAQVLARRR